jgi:copper chaperone
MRTRFAVPDISCESCKTAIESALRPVSGVEAVEVDVAGRVVDVVHDPAVDASGIAAAVEAQGYEVVAQGEVAGRGRD